MQNQLCHQMSTKRINDASNIFPRANIKQLSVRTRVCNRQELYVDRTPLRLEKKEKKKNDCVNDLLHNAPPTPVVKVKPNLDHN